ncbi:hypothetical protein RSOLAG22IIIB_10168 [Rhizoctonia solani]|uniref:Uncharacterized protein n=1 Tax=Rhizoctonia solani TaxID=456999 RepID=A0A0K6G266_9AGAM|nr:hypothetical protein RSOLAG22IIIB_10168 [Rhizoctonia solani]
MMASTIRPLMIGAVGEQEPVNATVSPVEVEEISSQPLAGIVVGPAAKQVILDMLRSGVPESVARSIFDTGYYEIIVPSKPTRAPYIAITYTNDVQEGHVCGLNAQPVQDAIFLTIPKPGTTAAERGQWEEEETWDGFHWGSVEYHQGSGGLDAVPWPVLYTIPELDDLEPVSGLQIYFAECDDNVSDLSVPTVDSNLEPWYSSKLYSGSGHTDYQEWSDDYELGDLRNLVVIEEDAELEQDFSMSAYLDSDLDYSEMDWDHSSETTLTDPGLEFD